MTLAPVSPAPRQGRVGHYPPPPWNARQRLFPADGWMHNNLRMFVGGTPGLSGNSVYGRAAKRPDRSTRGRPDGPAWLHATATQAVGQ